MTLGRRIGPAVEVTSSAEEAESSWRMGSPTPRAAAVRQALAALSLRAPRSANAAFLPLAWWRPAAADASGATPTAVSAVVIVAFLPTLLARRRGLTAAAAVQLVSRACGRTRRPPWSATRGTRRMAQVVRVEAACGRTNQAEAASSTNIIFYLIAAVDMVDTLSFQEPFNQEEPYADLETVGARALGAAVTLRRYRPSARLTKEEGVWLTWPANPRWDLLHGACKYFNITRIMVVVVN